MPTSLMIRRNNNRGHIPAGMHRHRCSAAVVMGELLVGTPLPNLHEAEAEQYSNHFGFQLGRAVPPPPFAKDEASDDPTRPINPSGGRARPFKGANLRPRFPPVLAGQGSDIRRPALERSNFYECNVDLVSLDAGHMRIANPHHFESCRHFRVTYVLSFRREHLPVR